MQAISRNWTKRRIATALTYCVPAFALLLATGCAVNDPCANNACDDSDACTTDTCEAVDGEAVCTNTPVDCGDQVCNPDDGECVDCLADTDCADDAFCNGDETCVDNACVDGTAPCAEGESCDEDADECVVSCTDDASCDDGLFCTGTETCGEDGLCASSGDPCNEGETCNEDTDTCDVPAPDCTSNGDCAEGQECIDGSCVDIVVPDCNSNGDCPDDGLFCNGTESCNTNSFECVSSGNPCAEGFTCDEDTDTCVNNNPTANVVLTPQIDLINSGPGDDIITGTRDGSADGNTISIGDDIDGEAGRDRANFIVTDNSVPSIDMSNVEELFVRALDASIAFSVANYVGLDTVGYNNGNDDLNIEDLANIVDIVLIGGDNTDFEVTFADDVLDTDDGETVNVMVDNADIADLEIWDENTNNEGPEVINIITCGGTSVIDDIESGDESGDEGGTINITGPDDLTLNDLGNAETVDGSNATGNLDINVDNGNDVSITTGSGDDIIRFGNDLDDMDEVDAGTGNDRLALASAVTLEDLTMLDGVEEFEISGALTVDFDNITAGVIVFTGANDTVADNVAKNTPIRIFGAVDDCTVNVDGAGSVGSNNDSLTVTFGEDETAATFGGDDLIIPDVETLNFVSMEGANGGLDLNADSCSSIVITGDEDFEFDVLAASAALNNVDASGLGGALDIDTTLITQDITIIGTDDDDTIAVNDNATTDATIVGGPGADAIDLGGATANSIQTIAYLSVDDIAADIDENLTDADVVGAGDEFDVSEDVVEISGALRAALSANSDNNNTAAGAADLDADGLFFFNVGADLGANGANADVFATVNAAIGALANETVGDTAVFAVLNSNADDGMAVYLFISDDADNAVTQDELQLMGYFDSDAACTSANINLN